VSYHVGVGGAEVRVHSIFARQKRKLRKKRQHLTSPLVARVHDLQLPQAPQQLLRGPTARLLRPSQAIHWCASKHRTNEANKGCSNPHSASPEREREGHTWATLEMASCTAPPPVSRRPLTGCVTCFTGHHRPVTSSSASFSPAASRASCASCVHQPSDAAALDSACGRCATPLSCAGETSRSQLQHTQRHRVCCMLTVTR
jgi:hypothetical protein